MLLVIILQQLIQAGSFYDGHILGGICSLLHGDLALFPGGPGKNDSDIIGRNDIITFTMIIIIILIQPGYRDSKQS